MSFDDCNNNACKRPRSSLSVYCDACLAAVAVDEARAQKRADTNLAAMFGREAPETELDRKVQESMQKACEGRLHEPEVTYTPQMERQRQQSRDHFESQKPPPTPFRPNGHPDNSGRPRLVPALPDMATYPRGLFLSSEILELAAGMHRNVVIESYESLIAMRFSVSFPMADGALGRDHVGLLGVLYCGSHVGIPAPLGSAGTPCSLLRELYPLPKPVKFQSPHDLVFEFANHSQVHRESLVVTVECVRDESRCC